MEMDRSFLESLMSKVQNPARACVKWYDHKFYYIESAERTNDTLGWYHINSKVVEDALEEKGFSWCYAFETAPEQSPIIYMFFGNGMTQKTLEEEFGDSRESLPEGRSLYFEDAPFSSIDVDQYDNSRTVLEQELFRKASEVFRVYEP